MLYVIELLVEVNSHDEFSKLYLDINDVFVEKIRAMSWEHYLQSFDKTANEEVT